LPDMGEYHAGQLVPAFKFPGAMVSLVFIYDVLELVARQQVQKLGEDICRAGHIYFLRVKNVDIRMTSMLSGKIPSRRKITIAIAFGQREAQQVHFWHKLIMFLSGLAIY